MRHVKKLYLGWYGENRRSWYPVGQFAVSGDEYVFYYLAGAIKARQEAGFRGVFQFPDFERTYRSRELFAFVSNRVMSPRRPDYEDHARRLGLETEGLRPFDILSRSYGRRMTDTYELYAAPERDGDTIELDFFARGVRYLDKSLQEFWTNAAPEPPLYLRRERNNQYDRFATEVCDADDRKLGYLPRYYTESLSQVVDASCEYRLELLQHNREPGFVRERFLLRLNANVPGGWHFPQSEMYKPLSTLAADDSEVA